MANNKKLVKALKEQKRATEQTQLRIFGTLGIPLGGQRLVEVPDRPSFVYVQLRTTQNEVIQAFNNTVAASYGLPVIVQRQANRYIVLGVDTARYQNLWVNSSPYLPKHGNTHSFIAGGGGDVTWIYSQQFMPLNVYPTGTVGGGNVIISPHLIQSVSGTWIYVGNTGTANLLQYSPSSGSLSVMILVYMDRTTGNPGLIINSGNYFPNTLTTAPQIAPFIPPISNPATQIPLGAVRINSGTSAIDWNYIYDVRPFLQYIPTGTGGGSTIVTGSSPSTPFTGIPVYKDGQFIATGTAFDFEQNLYVGATGSTIFVRNPVTTYQRFEQPDPLLGITGVFWKVPDGVYASGSLGVFYNGIMQAKGIHYNEQLWVSGTYQLNFVPATGTYHMVSYGVPCFPQIQTSTGTSSANQMVDSNGTLMVDSNGIQLVDSNG